RNTIWLGTGEVNSSRSSYAGAGIYKSTDGGKSWTYHGLPETHHIGRILLHPDDPNTAWVAALGHLYSPNPERGVYKTTDGGRSWRKTLFVNEDAGAVDMIMDPDDPNTLYAAIWERTRRAWNFVESGEGSGIYKSTDGGENWMAVTGSKNGFPSGEGVGRIGLAIAKVEGENVLYASLDNYFRRPREEVSDEDVLTKDRLREMNAEEFLQLENYVVTEYLRENRFPRKYDAESIKKMVENGEIKPVALVEFTEDANSLLFDTEVIGLEVYRSTDGGKSWERTHDDYIDQVYNSYGYYFGQIRVSPLDPDRLYVMGVPILRSGDGGSTWTSINQENVHVDHHALWVSPDRPGHLILGNDGGVNISYDDGETWIKCNSTAVGQFYAVAVDMAEPYNVYGGLQDNGVWKGPSNYDYNRSWEGEGHYPYEQIMGGDGMQVAVDTRDNTTVITGFQFGNYFRIDTKSRRSTRITPQHELGDRPYRWNWQTPIHLSSHNQDILYMGSNMLHRSFNQGDDWEVISDDLTKGGRKGDVAFGTLTTVHESPLQFGLLYAGSDDGLIHVSRDGGHSWQRISDGLPQNLWVTRLQASAHDKSTVYASLNGYRWDDFNPYLYVSRDYGQTWQRIGLDLPIEPINDVHEDPVNADILYVGTDHGLYTSLDGGDTFQALGHGIPAVAVHDVLVHPRENDLIVGTHGRSIYKGNVAELQQLTPELMQEDLHLFALESPRASSRWGNTFADWMDPFEPELDIPLYARSQGTATVRIHHGEDLLLHTFQAEVVAGLNYLEYDLSIDEEAVEAYQAALNEKVKKDQKPIELEKADNGKYYLQEGKYTVTVYIGETEKNVSLEIR
ncbi:MAG: glycosyl hydrolase, partial [Saprospiraceae bacterium]|nr:glycosyl hydrolase [Saprospiraceae bacterium]